jgi:hypothetical protein
LTFSSFCDRLGPLFFVPAVLSYQARKVAKSATDGRKIHAHSSGASLARSSWWHPTKELDDVTKLVGSSTHGHFAVIVAQASFNSAENFKIVVNDNGTVLEIAINNFTVDLTNSGCHRVKVGKFLPGESVHAVMTNLSKQPLLGKSGATLKFDTPVRCSLLAKICIR